MLSTSPRSPPWLQLQTQKCLSKQAQLGCGWVLFYLASSIRIHLHAEVWIFRPFKVNSLQYVNRLLSRRSSLRGLQSTESISCSASSGMNNSLCHISPWGCRMLRTFLQCLQLLPSLTSPAHGALSSLPLSRSREGQEASHAMPGVVSGRPTAHRGTEGHALLSPSLPSPLPAHHRAHANCFAVRSLPCCWVWLKLAGGFKLYRGRLIDRQIDNVIVRASFL